MYTCKTNWLLENCFQGNLRESGNQSTVLQFLWLLGEQATIAGKKKFKKMDRKKILGRSVHKTVTLGCELRHVIEVYTSPV